MNKAPTVVSDVCRSMFAMGYKPVNYHNGEHIPYNGPCAFASTVTNVKDLIFDSWEEAAEWLKSVGAWRTYSKS